MTNNTVAVQWRITIASFRIFTDDTEIGRQMLAGNIDTLVQSVNCLNWQVTLCCSGVLES
jgi:hypothetical protein